MKRINQMLCKSLSVMAASSAGLMMLALVGCSEEDLQKNKNIIGFTIGTDNTTSSRGIRINTDNLDDNYNGDIGIRSFFGTNFYFDNVLNYESNHRWKTPVTYYWPNSTDVLDFWAWAPKTLPTGKGTREDISEKVNNTAKTITFEYTMQAPDATNKKDAENQPDLLFAYTSAKMTDYDGCVPLTFKHALAAIRFKVANEGVYTIQTIKLTNIKSHGTCTYDPQTIAPAPSFAWIADGSENYTQTFDSENVTRNEVATYTLIGEEKTTFLIIPQTFVSTAKLIISYNNGSEDVTNELTIPSMEVKPGYCYTFVLSLNQRFYFDIEVEERASENAGTIKF